VCQPSGLPNRLYRNRGNGTFEDITESSGLGVLENTACAVFADFSNRGRQDVIVVRASGPLLFVNEGGGKFRQKPDAFHFASPPQGTFTGAAAADYDRDGLLDVYFCLYAYYQGTGQYKYPSPYHDAENGPPNFLMHNNGDGTFHDVTAESGVNQNNTRYSFCCGWSDYNGDGWPDLYVVNDFGRKNLYRNRGDGTFTDVASEMSAEDVGAGMSVAWLDFDNDGAEDLYVGNMWTAAGERISMQGNFKKESSSKTRSLYQKHAMGNSLLRNRGVVFEEATSAAGVGMGRWAWSSDTFDFDHDGFPDLYIANGMVSGPQRQDLSSFFWRQVVALSPDQAGAAHAYEEGWNAINELIRSDGTWSGYERNVFYANNRDGTFSDVSAVVGLDFVEILCSSRFRWRRTTRAIPEKPQRAAVADPEKRDGGTAAVDCVSSSGYEKQLRCDRCFHYDRDWCGPPDAHASSWIRIPVAAQQKRFLRAWRGKGNSPGLDSLA
jgi:hypothetical protein